MAVKSADQITIIDVTDAYSVMLTSEAYTFIGNTSGVPVGQSCSTEAVAFCGSNQCSSIVVNADDIICPTGITAAVSNSGSARVMITFTTSAVVSEACEASIPIMVGDITMNKKFSFAVALRGATGDKGDEGRGITSVTNYYLASSASSGVTTSTSGWTTTMQSTSTSKKYLWCYQKITYTSGDPTTTTPVIIGTHGSTGDKGDTGDEGRGITSVTNYYLASSASSGVTTSTSGWTTTMQSTSTSKKYLWCYQKITYTSGDPTTTTPVIIGTHGETGNNGEDALTLTITSSNGTVFKNSSGSTVLTAHVFKGAVEQTITDAGVCGSLGTIKWYKGSSTTAVATAKTYTVTAKAVTNSEVFTCQLE